MGHSGPPTFFKTWNGIKYTEQQILDMMNSFDLAVLESPRPISVQSLELLEKRRSLPPVVLVDSEDYDYIHDDLIKKFSIEVIFKREMTFNLKNVHPFPFSSYIIGDQRYQFPDAEKDLDVFFIAGHTHKSRALVSKTLKSIVKKHGYKGLIGLDNEPEEPLVDHSFRFRESGVRLGLKDYLSCIAKSKIAVSVRGFGRDTIRFWEIPSYNTLLLSDDLYSLGLIHPYPFEHQKNAVFFKPDCSDLEQLLLYYLEDDSEREKVSKAGHEHLSNFHSNIKRAELFLDNVKDLI